jgi:glycosyltransferase involved in cell wall biosynthesis
VTHSGQRGYGAAIRSGLAAARHDHVLLTDGDRQFDPADLARLIAGLDEADVVVGYRRRRADPWGRRLGGVLWTWLVGATLGVWVRDVNCAFKLLPRRAIDGLSLVSDGAVISAELLARLTTGGWRIAEVPVSHLPRLAGRASGGSGRVILRAMGELVRLRRRLRSAAPYVAPRAEPRVAAQSEHAR